MRFDHYKTEIRWALLVTLLFALTFNPYAIALFLGTLAAVELWLLVDYAIAFRDWRFRRRLDRAADALDAAGYDVVPRFPDRH